MKAISVIIFFLLGCNKNQGNVHILDVSKDTTIVLSTAVKNPSMLKLKINGKVDKPIQIQHLFVPGGRVDTMFIMDWYTHTLSIRYKAHEAQKGVLEIKYHLF